MPSVSQQFVSIDGTIYKGTLICTATFKVTSSHSCCLPIYVFFPTKTDTLFTKIKNAHFCLMSCNLLYGFSIVSRRDQNVCLCDCVVEIHRQSASYFGAHMVSPSSLQPPPPSLHLVIILVGLKCDRCVLSATNTKGKQL